MNLNGVIGDYDIRGCVGDEFNANEAYLIGRSFGSIVRCNGGNAVAVGYDRRISSIEFNENYSRGLMDSGIDVISLGRVSTAYTNLSYKFLGTYASTMITASHNPSKYNGFKFFVKGNSFYGKNLVELRDRVRNSAFHNGKGKMYHKEFFKEYIHYLLQHSNIRGTKVIWDAGHGVSGDILEHCKKHLPSSHIFFRVEENNKVSDFDNTKIEFLNHTCKILQSNPGYIALAFDGDADRMVAVDEEHKIWNGDEILCLFSLIARLKAGRHITTVWDSKSSQTLSKWANKFNIETILSKTGHCYVMNSIKSHEAELGGEISGHYMFRDRFFCVDDGIYSGIRLLEILNEMNCKLSDLRAIMPQVWASKSIRLNCENNDKHQVIEHIKDVLLRSNVVMEKLHDSILINHHNGWWLVRASQTENVISARCEGWNKEAYQEIKNFMEATLSSCGLNIHC